MPLTARQLILKYLLIGFKRGVYWELLCMIPLSKLWDSSIANVDRYSLLVLQIISNIL